MGLVDQDKGQQLPADKLAKLAKALTESSKRRCVFGVFHDGHNTKFRPATLSELMVSASRGVDQAPNGMWVCSTDEDGQPIEIDCETCLKLAGEVAADVFVTTSII